jgi:hypothetical protein
MAKEIVILVALVRSRTLIGVSRKVSEILMCRRTWAIGTHKTVAIAILITQMLFISRMLKWNLAFRLFGLLISCNPPLLSLIHRWEEVRSGLCVWIPDRKTSRGLSFTARKTMTVGSNVSIDSSKGPCEDCHFANCVHEIFDRRATSRYGRSLESMMERVVDIRLVLVRSDRIGSPRSCKESTGIHWETRRLWGMSGGDDWSSTTQHNHQSIRCARDDSLNLEGVHRWRGRGALSCPGQSTILGRHKQR